MRGSPPPFVERRRVAGEKGDMNGHFMLNGPEGHDLFVVVSNGSDWHECGLADPPWEHVSVTRRPSGSLVRIPTWREMEFVRSCFFEDEELVLQFSVPRSKHVNVHEGCLHLWRPIGAEVPLPPPATV